MNEYKNREDLIDSRVDDKLQRDEKDIATRRKPIIVGSSTVSTEVAETMDPRLSTADIAGRNQGTGTTTSAPATQADEPSGPLFSPEEAGEFRSRWDSIQVGFVDEPRRSVEQADNLVASIIKHLVENFADERERLETQWGQGQSVSTEDLRLALRRYRSFFGRLLSI